MSVTFIMNGFRRPHTLREQFFAIQNQTIKEFEILLWINQVDNVKFDTDIINSCKTIVSNTDFGSWGRFVAALNARTKYVCVIDDDTIPGTRWLENCYNTMKTHPGVLSTRGALMNKDHDLKYPMPESYQAIGWCSANENVTRVDMGCHSWFFEKSWLRAFFAEMPENFPMRYGEDTHLSYAVKKHFDINSYVPPHPSGNKDLWGSMPETALRYGEEPVAISMDYYANVGMNKYWNFVRQAGHPIVAEDEEENSEIYSSTK